MNNRRFRIVTCIPSLILAMAPAVSAHEAVDPLHSTPVEVMGSRLATPIRIHVAKLPDRLEVKGVLERRASIRRKSLKGHVDIEILDGRGERVDFASLSIRPLSAGPARIDHERRFKAILSRPPIDVFSVRVRHVLTANHVDSE